MRLSESPPERPSSPSSAPSSPSSPGQGTVSIPGVGKLPTWAVLGGVGLVLVLIIRNRSGSSSAAASTDPAGNTGVIDPATGFVAGSPEDLAALQTSAAASTPGTGGAVDTSTAGQVASGPPFTSTAAWSQYAISVLEGNGYDPGALSSELGAYINGQPVTAAQESDINAAIAVAGYPPVAGANGYPPAINVSGSKSGGSGPSSGSRSRPPAAWQYPAPENLTARPDGRGKILVQWAPVVGPDGHRPSSYTVAYGRKSGEQTWRDTAAGTSYTITASAGRTLYIEVWANGGPVAPPHAGPIKATAGS